jgi:hypothetical protein
MKYRCPSAALARAGPLRSYKSWRRNANFCVGLTEVQKLQNPSVENAAVSCWSDDVKNHQNVFKSFTRRKI